MKRMKLKIYLKQNKEKWNCKKIMKAKSPTKTGELETEERKNKIEILQHKKIDDKKEKRKKWRKSTAQKIDDKKERKKKERSKER